MWKQVFIFYLELNGNKVHMKRIQLAYFIWDMYLAKK